MFAWISLRLNIVCSSPERPCTTKATPQPRDDKVPREPCVEADGTGKTPYTSRGRPNVPAARSRWHDVGAAAGPSAAPPPLSRLPDRSRLHVRRLAGQLAGRAGDLLRLPVAVP